MKTILPLLVAALVWPGRAAQEIVLENEHVRVTVDPGRGGAVTSMVRKKAATFPFIAERGAGIAGRGELFGERHGASMKLLAEGAEGEERRAVLEAEVEGLRIRRTFRMGKEESGFRIADEYHPGPDRKFRPGARSALKAEPWRLVARSWAGDRESVQARNLPAGGPEKGSAVARGSWLFWRLIGPYGVGFLYSVDVPGAAPSFTHGVGREAGTPVDYSWEGPERLPEAAGAWTVEARVLIDEGGREGNAPAALSGPAIVTLDLRTAGKTGEAMPAFATAVSPRPFRGKLELSAPEADFRRSFDLELSPGRGRIVPFELVPRKKGALAVEAVLVDGAGIALGTARASSLIDGEKEPAWAAWSRTIPGAVYKGTWSEIGAQLARAGRLKPHAPDPAAAERLAFYGRKFPHYAELIRGAAEALGRKPDELARAGSGAAPAEACMNVLFTGPDGPINAFSKERSGAGLGGLAYMKVLPDKGYAYHVYECGTWQNGYGVNSEGLSTTGASINCDAGTTEAGRKATQEWKAAGKRTAPLGSHLMLATCRNVEEAVAFIEDREAPFEFEGNMLLVDRSGAAARLESVGIRRQIERYDPKKDRFFVAGNYPHERGDGLFKIGPDWGWAANTMMRERLLEELAGPRAGRIGLREAVSLMETHAAGGMCQHVHDNVGRLHTSTSFLAVTRTSELWLSHGPPCRTRYSVFPLRE